MRSRVQDHISDIHSPYLTLGPHNKYALNQVSRILGGVTDSSPHRKTVRGVTIDGANSLDLDDAVWVEKNAHGMYRVEIHIADVSEYIPLFSPLDIEALHRMTSIYRGDVIHNMFPTAISHGVLSLDPSGGEKLTCTLQVDIDQEGELKWYQFFESRFTNLRRYDHESFGRDYINSDSDFFPTLHLLNELSTKLRVKRISQGGILHFGDENRRLALDSGTSRKGDISPAAKMSHDIVESLMVLANTTIGHHLAQHPGVPSIFRRHDTLNEQSFYYHKPCQHVGLRVANYMHFTSPIRRYIDLVVHRILKALVRGDETPYTQLDIQFIAAHANNVRLLVDTYGSQIIQEDKGTQFIQKITHRLGRTPMVYDMKTFIKNTTLQEKNLPRAVVQAITENILGKPRDTWIWAVGVILLSKETVLKKILKERILNHTGMRVRGFLNVLEQTKITLGETPIFLIDEQEENGKYTMRILCKGICIAESSCDVGGENIHRDGPHQCRREVAEKVFDFFIDDE